METTGALPGVIERANKWISNNYDEDTKQQVRHLIEHDEKELVDSFYKNLEFGTGGLRGIMGVGTNRMNIYTVGMATQGLCNYLKNVFKDLPEIKAVIAHDSRNNSRLFAEKTAEIFSANGITVYLFDSLRPTPELSFAIRQLGCQSGIVVTASHNPKEYNGYKVYWEDGGQIIAPHDKNIIAEVQKIKDVDEVNFKADTSKIQIIGEDIDEHYTNKLKELSLSPGLVKKYNDLKIVYTPIHGTGVKLVPQVLKKFGFLNVYSVPEQDIPDGDFPTVHSPNPEEPEALAMALGKAKDIDADLVFATDPDADRVGIAVKDSSGKHVLLNGNQAATLLIYYLLSKWKENNKLSGREYIVKTIVTTDLLRDMAEKFKVEHFEVLTGFKYIANIIHQLEGKKQFIGGGEESYGYLVGDFVRDKDAVISCAMIAEAATWAKEKGKTLYELLLDIYTEYNLYKEKLVSLVKKGKSGEEEINAMMVNFRKNPPKSINNADVLLIKDYLSGESKNMLTGKTGKIDLPKSDVLQFITSDGTKISIRPSGTEPKIKFYFSVRSPLEKSEDYDHVSMQLDKKIQNIINQLSI